MISFKKLPNGFEYIEVSNSVAKAKIALQGAHLFHYQRQNDETPILWVSEASNFILGESIRGGIPLCWPWFGMHKTNADMPQHGFARTFMWKLLDSKDLQNSSKLTLLLVSSEESLAFFPYKFELTYTLTIGKELTLELTTKNCDDKSFNITQALHTYFNISHISNIHVNGLEERPYFDALTSENKIQKGNITFNQELDRVYQKVNTPISLVDSEREITISNRGSDSAIVWNPWLDKCSRMSAMKSDSYETMVCIESANAFDDIRTVTPNGIHHIKTTVTIK